jgi:GNAT superfamily N-acetyltransferase
LTRLREILDALARNHKPSESWLELVRDLEAPIAIPMPAFDFLFRCARKEDLLSISAMQGFVKEIDFLETALQRGDLCKLLEIDGGICAFAYVTFRDYRLGPWHTLQLPPGFAYLVYIHVEPEYRRKGVGTYLLNCLMKDLREMGYRRLISGMYEDWKESILLHTKSGFQICRKYTQRRIFRFFPYPPRKTPIEPS